MCGLHAVKLQNIGKPARCSVNSKKSTAGTSSASAYNMFGRKKASAPESPLQLVGAYDAAACESGTQISGKLFDHTPETIPLLESILSGLYDDLHQTTLKARIGLGSNEADAEQWANLWGIYLGETLRGMMGGQWITGHQEAPNLLALAFPEGTVAFPTARVFRYLTVSRQQNSIADYVAMLQAEVAGFGDDGGE